MASKISIPAGMDAALEGLARAVLKEQPDNIYVFAVQHFERLVRMRDTANLKTHNAGLSPSSTQDSNSKPPVSDEDAKPISEEKSVTEEPESNDTSYGVEATAVRTLAATTGTVAILGTTAKSNDKNKNDHDEDDEAPNTSTPPIASDVIPEGNEKEEDTVAVIHDTVSKPKDEVSTNETEELKKTTSPLDTRPTSAVKTEHILLEEVKDNTQSTTNKTDDISVVDNKPSPVDDVEKRTSSEHTEGVPSTVETDNSKPEDVSVTEKEDREVERDSTPEKTEVETIKDVTSEVSNAEPKPKEDEVTKTEETEDDKGSEANKGNEEDNSKSISSERLKTNSISDTTLSESYNGELENNSIKQSPSADKAAESFDSSSTIEFVDLENKENARQKRDVSYLSETKESNVPSENTVQGQENQTHVVVNLESEPSVDKLPNVPSEQEATDRSENITGVNEEQLVEVKPEDRQLVEVTTSDKQIVEVKPSDRQLVEVTTSDKQLIEVKPSDRAVAIVYPTAVDTYLESQNVTPAAGGRPESVTKSDAVTEEPTESGPKVDEVPRISALSKSEELEAGEQRTQEIDVNKAGVDDEAVDEAGNTAATTIQATFRGFQTRKQLKEEKDQETQEKVEGEETSNETVPNQANLIVTTDEKQIAETEKNDLRTDKVEVPDNVVESEDSKLESAATTIQATFRGFQTRKHFKEEVQDESEPRLENTSQPEVNEKLNETPTAEQAKSDKAEDEIQENIQSDEDKINSAATTIQSTFRGFQTRKHLKDDVTGDANDEESKENVSEVTRDRKDAVLASEEVNGSDKGVQSEVNEEKITNEAEDGTANTAATTIQATFRGFQTRKQLKNETENEYGVATTEDNVSVPAKQEENETDEKVNLAATTIQATFRGFQTRKQLKDGAEEIENNGEGDTEAPSAKTDSSVAEEETKAKAVGELETTEENVVIATEDGVVNSAATTIQATFRGFQTRKHLKDEESQIRGEEKVDENDAVYTKTSGGEKLSDHKDGDDSKPTEEQNETETGKTNAAATAIQATFRGYQARKQLEDEKEDETNAAATAIQATFRGYQARKQLEDEKEDETNAAATTIQASFRGYQARKQLEDEKEDETNAAATTIQATFRGYQARKQLEDEKEDETNAAATTIQATFRGFQARKQLKDEKEDASKPTEESKVENETKNIPNSEESKESIIQAVDDIIDSAATTIQAAYRGFQVRQQIKHEETPDKDLAVENDVPTEPTVSSDAGNASNMTDDLAATRIQATFRGFQVRQQIKTENDENIENKLEHSPVDHSPSELSKASEDESEQLKRQSEGDKDSLSEEIRQSLSKLEDTIQREENKLNMANESLPEQIGESSDEGYEQPDANGGESFDRDTRTALTPEQIDIVKEEVDEICKQAVATTESILAEKIGLGDHHAIDEVITEEPEDKETDAKTQNDSKQNKEEVVSAVPSEETTQKDTGTVISETLVVIEDADEELVSAATTIQASFRGYQTRQRLAETEQTEQSEQPDSLPDFPPPALDDEYLFGPSVADEDLPPPDFEALESSYSEDAPTEPLAPPPPLDQDTEKFIEEEEEDIDEDELKSLQRPPECDELPENRLTIDKSTSGETETTGDTNTSTDAESSLSSAATKIQAGVRGYLTRKQIHGDTTSTSGPSIVDSDQSLGNLSTSREEEGPVRSNISMEEESEICRHQISPEISEELKQTNSDQPRRPTDKRMSLGSNIIEQTTAKRKPLRAALSVQVRASEVGDDEVWDVLKNEMSEAATVIQSRYRGYRARKQLQREDAVQVLTSSSSVATNGVSSIDRDSEAATRNSGELHDIIALTPPNIEQTSSIAEEGALAT